MLVIDPTSLILIDCRIKQMSVIRYREITNTQESKAVNHLLELADHRTIKDDNWHAELKHQHHNQKLSSKLIGNSKLYQRRSFRLSSKAQSLDKIQDKQKLKQSARDSTENNQESVQMPSKYQAQLGRHERVSMSFVKNAKLRPFNSNMTFYNVTKKQKERVFNSSLTFYQNSLKLKHSSQADGSGSRNRIYNAIKEDQMRSSVCFKNGDDNSKVINFKPNKSHTIRQILTHIKEEKQKNKQIVLNSAQRELGLTQFSVEQANYLNDFEVKQLKKYSKFIPFKEDESLLLKKISQNQNVWMRKFKESWLRKKKSMQTGKQKNYFKRLIIKD